MATVRELVAKLGFEVDTSGADQFKKSIEGVRSALNGIAAFKILKAANALENTFLKDARAVELLAGPKGLGALNTALEEVGKTASKSDIAEAFRIGVEKTSDPAFVGQVVKSAEKLAAIFGTTIGEETEMLTSGAMGGIDQLVKRGLFTQQQAEAIQAGGGLTTRRGKEVLLVKLAENRLKIEKQYNKALKDSSTQSGILFRNVKNFGLEIGTFVNPALSALLETVNKLFDAFNESPLFKGAAKILALTAGLALVISSLKVIITLGWSLSAALLLPFLKLLLISAAIGGLILVVQDLWAVGWESSALKQGLDWLLDRLFMISPVLQILSDSIRIIFGTDLKETMLGKSLIWMQDSLNSIAADFNELTSSFAKGVSDFGSSIGQSANMALAPQVAAMSSTSQNNNETKNVTNNITFEQVDQKGLTLLEQVLEGTGVSTKENTMNEISRRRGPILGANAQ